MTHKLVRNYPIWKYERLRERELVQFLHSSCFVTPPMPPLKLALDSNKLEHMHRVKLDARVTNKFVKIARVLVTGQVLRRLI
jgi:hypothetical protein